MGRKIYNVLTYCARKALGRLQLKGAIMAQKHPKVSRPRSPRKHQSCEPFSQILVYALAPGTQPAGVNCTSTAPFLVYCLTNYFGTGGAPPSWGCAVAVKSAGAGFGSASPVFTVGGVAKDIVTTTFEPGTTGFITLQTPCDAKASITST